MRCRRSCEIKAWVVGQDEREAGLRAILNFGHTFGHAIEAGLGYGQWLHGEAVGCGMVMALHLSQRLGLVDGAFVERVTALLRKAGLPAVGPALGADRYLELMRVDKKAEAGEIRFVVIDRPGSAAVRGAPDALVREVIEHCCRARPDNDAGPLCLRSGAVARPAPRRGSRARRAPSTSATGTASSIPPRSGAWSTRPRCS